MVVRVGTTNEAQERNPEVGGAQLDYIYHNGLEKWKTDIVDPVKEHFL